MMEKVILNDCFIRSDWKDYVSWKWVPFEYNRQHKKKLNLPVIFDKNDIYFDGRTRIKKVRVKITMEELEG